MQKINIIPRKYIIEIKPDINNHNFDGLIYINFDTKNEIDTIILDSVKLKILKCELLTENKKSKLTNFHTTDSNLIISHKILNNTSATLIIHYTGKISNDLKGLYLSSYNSNNKTETLLSTQFEPTDARKVIPCVDHPNYKAIFSLKLIIPSELNAISNMPVMNEMAISKSLKEIKFSESPIMSTYLLFFAIGKISSKEIKTKEGVLIRVWATENKEIFSDFALEISVKLLDYFESYFGVKYPLPKLDHIAIPDFAAGAMENWGCISYRENALLVDPNNSSLQTKQLVAAIIAHEMAHMWFGDLVTMSWWNDLWLNESFASWMGDKAISNIHPEWDVWTKFILDDTNRAFELDALDNSHPIEQAVTNPNEIGQLFDAISYSKGASLIRMLENYLGESIFQKGIQIYIKKHAYKNTTTDDLWEALSLNSNIDVKNLMDNWTKKTGFPLIELTQKNNNEYEVNQSKFSFNESSENQSDWIIPIKYYSKNKNEKIENSKLISKKSNKIKNISNKPSDITIFNENSAGFYKTIYPKAFHNKLIGELKKNINIIPSEERLGLLSDTYILLKANKISPEFYLNLLPAFMSENNPYIWKYLCGSLRSIDLKLYETSIYKNYFSYISNLLNHINIEIDWNFDNTTSETEQLMKATLLENLSYFQNKDITTKAKNIFNNYNSKNKEKIHPNLKRPLFLARAYEGKSEDFDKIWKLYLESDSQEEKSLYLGSLTQFNNYAKISFLLSQVLTNNIRKHDIASLMLGIANNKIGHELSWNFLKENWNKIIELCGDGFQLNSIVTLPSRFQTNNLYQEVNNFYKENPLSAASMSVEQTLERIQNNITWIDTNFENFKKSL
jgi:aminopeptidase N